MIKESTENILWNNYWRERQNSLQNPQGKMRAVTAAYETLEKLRNDLKRPLRIIELGCGEGHILGDVLRICADNRIPIEKSVGVDNQVDAIRSAGEIYPRTNFIVADYTTQILRLEPFDLVMMIGTLHEVYSSNYSKISEEIDHEHGQKAVVSALFNNLHLVKDNGYILLFDGVEHSLPLNHSITIKFHSDDSLNEFKKFADEYKAFHIRYKYLNLKNCIEVSIRDFTRYITKTRFINSNLWEIEKWESYQYFTENEFRKWFDYIGLRIIKLSTASPYEKDWQQRVKIKTPRLDFPKENILIIGQKSVQN